MIKAVLFDLDGTLYDYDKAHAAAIAALAHYAAETLEVTETEFRTLYRWAMREALTRSRTACAAIHNRLIRCQLILERLEKPLSLARPMEALYWNTLLDHMIPSPGVGECFRTLRADGYRIGIGTNMTADYQFEKLIRLDLLDSVDFIVSSEEANAEKPDPLFFACCLRKTGCPAEACAFVGDNPEHDVYGSRVAGMRPIWFCPVPPEDRTGDAALAGDAPRIVSLADLPPLLRSGAFA